jgi:hypothetical protein
MSDNLVRLVLVLAYAPLLLMGLLWIAALGLRLAGKPGLSQWLAARTSIPRPEADIGRDEHA